MRIRETYFWWAMYLAGAGLIISLIVTIGLITGFMVPLILPPVLWRIPLAMLVISGLCIVAQVLIHE